MKRRKLQKKRIILLLSLITATLLLLNVVYIKTRKVEINQFVDKTITASSQPSMVKTTICLDAGHGDEDGGAEYLNRYEKDDTLALTLLVGQYLEELYDYDVVYTRTDDTFLGNAERAELANRYQADAFISIHRNYYAGYENVSGIEAWVNSEEDRLDLALADAIIEKMIEAVPETVNRGVKAGTIDGEGDYTINLVADMPTLILEAGFITSDIDNTLFDLYLEDYAKAIATGIYEFIQNN